MLRVANKICNKVDKRMLIAELKKQANTVIINDASDVIHKQFNCCNDCRHLASQLKQK